MAIISAVLPFLLRLRSLSSATAVSNVHGIPAVVGYIAVVGLPAVVGFPAGAGVHDCKRFFCCWGSKLLMSP
jgi:hypothetical protein